MSSILELPEARARVARWSVEDYEQYGEMLADHGVLPKRAELIRGIIIEKMPKSALHVDLSRWVYDVFNRQLPPDHIVFPGGTFTANGFRAGARRVGCAGYPG